MIDMINLDSNFKNSPPYSSKKDPFKNHETTDVTRTFDSCQNTKAESHADKKKSLFNKALSYVAHGMPSVSIPLDAKKAEEHEFNDVEQPIINDENIGVMTHHTKYPVPVSYYLGLVSSDEISAVRKPKRSTRNILSKLFGEERIDWCEINGKKYSMFMTNKIPNRNVLIAMGLTGGYGTDIHTSQRMQTAGYNATTPWCYTMNIIGKKDYSPTCILPDTRTVSYTQNMALDLIPSYEVQSAMMWIASTNGWQITMDLAEDIPMHSFFYRCKLLSRGKQLAVFLSYSYREVCLDMINHMLDIEMSNS